MTRRLLAIVAILALSVACLSADAAGLAATASDCCAAGLCPMHHLTRHTADCDMDLRHPASQLQACPVHSQQFVSSLVFVRVAPPALAVGKQPRELVPLFSSLKVAAIAFDVAAPPPRTRLS